MHTTEKNTAAALLVAAITLICTAAAPLQAYAQQHDAARALPRQWESVLGSIVEDEDEAAAGWEDAYDALCQLEASPVDINSATREDLERIPFLSDAEIADILEFVYRNGRMQTMAELAMIPRLSAQKRRLLQYFVRIDAAGPTPHKGFPSLKNIVSHGNSKLIATASIPLYDRKGDHNGYLGYKYRHSLRYEYSYGKHLRLGFVGAQDAGEPFFAGRNRTGYDFYSFYAAARGMGRVKDIVVGRYRARMGLGLVLNNDLGFGKTAVLTSLNRSGSSLRPHSSRSGSNYMQGAAARLSLLPHLDLTPFFSWRHIDATLNKDDGSIASILRSGYHRTESEMAKKNNSSQLVAGANLGWAAGGFSAALTGCYTALDRRLSPNTAQLYRRFYAAGSRFYNIGMDYGYVSGRFSFHGETATGDSRAWATINTVAYRPSSVLTLTAVQRFYSYRYYSLLSRSFSEGGSVQNESGIYLGGSWQPARSMQVGWYTDIVYFPWAKYQASAASRCFDSQLSVQCSSGSWTLAARYRLKVREKDSEDKTSLLNHTVHRLRLSLGCATPVWSLQLRGDAVRSVYKEQSNGYMASLSGGTALKRLRLYAAAAYFHTDDYNSRIYSYERGMTYEFAFPSYSGEGIRYALLLGWQPFASLSFSAKLSTTDYFDRSVVGTALQQVNGSSLTDVAVQMKWKF